MAVRQAPHPVESLLKARGSSKRWLAQKLKMHDTQLNKYLSGALPAPANLYERIADILNVPVAFVRPVSEVPPAPVVEPEPEASAA
jgi:transcriptional regulator with XRE-family HTH domain